MKAGAVVETFGERLRSIRKDRGMTQEDIAAQIGVTKQTISQYERDVRRPDPNMLADIGDILHVSVDYLLGRTNDPIDYEDPVLLADLYGPIWDYFDGDAEKVYAVKKAIEEDAEREAAGWYINPETAREAQEAFDNYRVLFRCREGKQTRRHPNGRRSPQATQGH